MHGAILTAALLMAATPALAYVGPGLGAGLLAAIVGIFAAIGLALYAVLWFPIKRLLKRRRKGGGT
jgi:hypothetical protein